MTEVVAAFIQRGDTVLLCQRSACKARGLLWEFAGGKVEPGETKPQALARECREELGVTVEPDELLMELTYAYPDVIVHLTLFRAHIAQGEPRMLEHADLRWVPETELCRYDLCPADAALLQALRQG